MLDYSRLTLAVDLTDSWPSECCGVSWVVPASGEFWISNSLGTGEALVAAIPEPDESSSRSGAEDSLLSLQADILFHTWFHQECK